MKRMMLTILLSLAFIPALAADMIVISPSAFSKMDHARSCQEQIEDFSSNPIQDIKLPAYCYKSVQVTTPDELNQAIKNLDQKIDIANTNMQSFLRKDSREKQMLIREIMADPEFKAEILKFVKEELRKN